MDLKFESSNDEKDMASAMDITPERVTELVKIMQPIYTKEMLGGRYSSILAQISEYVETPQELSFISFQLGRNINE